MNKLKKVVPELNKDKYEMPPKVLFNKMAEKVVAYRSPALDLFLRATIENCKSYGTAEQDIIFTFLEAYDNIIRHVCANAAERDELVRAGMASVEGGQGGQMSPSGMIKGCEDEGVYDQTSDSIGGGGGRDTSWQTSFAAAVITAWVIMLSMGVEGFV